MNQGQDCSQLVVPPPSNLENKQSADGERKHEEGKPNKSEFICTQNSWQELDLYPISEHGSLGMQTPQNTWIMLCANSFQ